MMNRTIMWNTPVSGVRGIFLKGGVLQLDAGRDAAPALKKKVAERGPGGGGGHSDIFSYPQKKSHFPRHRAGVSLYMTDFTDKQASKKQQLEPKGGVWTSWHPAPCVRACPPPPPVILKAHRAKCHWSPPPPPC